jgi:hypothetical protein
VNRRLVYGNDERPPFAFCESIHAGSLSPWHIRAIPEGEGLKLGGGITTRGLCGRPERGWDLTVRITEHDLTHCCRACAALYIAMITEAPSAR